ncbi:MAG: NAD-dependent epimerase/dehydratase family protein [Solirubrobacterales bacterium]
MRALVTGGAGFIGSNLVDALLARGDEVTVVDDLSTGRRENLDGALAAGAQLVELDIREAAALAEAVAAARPEVVFHLAAQIDVRKSIADPAFDASINVGGTANLLEAARAAGSPRIVFSSTGGAIYGEGEGQALPLAEDAPIAPLSAYGQSKFAGEGYLALYERLYGMSAVSLRLGNVYGPRQDPLGEAGVIAIFCGRLRAGERPTVFGDGSQTRDYIYVGDVVAAMLAAAGSAASGPINVGTGIETDVLELARRLAELGGAGGAETGEVGGAAGAAGAETGEAGGAMGGAGGAGERRAAFEPEFAPHRTGEVQRIAIDPGRAERELGWRAAVGLEEGLRLTLDSP